MNNYKHIGNIMLDVEILKTISVKLMNIKLIYKYFLLISEQIKMWLCDNSLYKCIKQQSAQD